MPALIFALLTNLLLTTAFASLQDCQTVNLALEKDSPFHKIPVYNQEKINICYAYTAAQMVDYHLIKQGSRERNAHPAWLALQYALKRGKRSLEIGHTKEALEGLVEAGNCDYEAVTSSLRDLASSLDLSEPKILKNLEKNASSVAEIQRATSTHCQGSRRQGLKLPRVKMYNYKQLPVDEAYDQFVRDRLNQSPYPLSISYCSNIWKNPEFDGLTLNQQNVRDRLTPGCKYHESLIIGKKVIGESCHFLVRNTWGGNWTKDNQGLTCLCRNKLTGKISEECQEVNHPNANYFVEACWFPSQVLSKNIGQVTFFE